MNPCRPFSRFSLLDTYMQCLWLVFIESPCAKGKYVLLLVYLLKYVLWILMLDILYIVNIAHAVCCSVAELCPILRPQGLQACQASLSFTISWSLLKFMCIKLVMLSNHLILCHPFLLLPSIFSSIRVFSNESALHIR